jgi:hypothetical protein
MKKRKKEIEWSKDTKKMKRRDQVVISSLRTGYTMATHRYIINKQNNNKCPFCNVKETEAGRQRHPKQHLQGEKRNETTYRICQKNWFLPRDIDNMKEQYKNGI